MMDIIIILALIIGVILIIVGKKTPIHKYLKNLGILIIVVCLCMAIPDFIKGFKAGISGK